MNSRAYFFIAAVCFSAINYGECSVKCYICDSKSDLNCLNPDKHSVATHECTPTNLGSMKTTVEKLGLHNLIGYFDIEIDRSDYSAPFNCVKAVAKVDGKDIILRGCQLAPKGNLDVCKKLLDEGKDVVHHCTLCNENGCNSAPIELLSFSLIALLIPVLVFL